MIREAVTNSLRIPSPSPELAPLIFAPTPAMIDARLRQQPVLDER
jgi:hypothetical protein